MVYYAYQYLIQKTLTSSRYKILNFIRGFSRHGIARVNSALLMAYGKPSCPS